MINSCTVKFKTHNNTPNFDVYKKPVSFSRSFHQYQRKNLRASIKFVHRLPGSPCVYFYQKNIIASWLVKNSNDQVCSCPRYWRLSVSWELNWRTSETPRTSQLYGTEVITFNRTENIIAVQFVYTRISAFRVTPDWKFVHWPFEKLTPLGIMGE